MSKTIVVGDVHGCIDELHELLVKCEYNEYLDHLVFVGDLVGKVSAHPPSVLYTLLSCSPCFPFFFLSVPVRLLRLPF